jgi:hypothetical protein
MRRYIILILTAVLLILITAGLRPAFAQSTEDTGSDLFYYICLSCHPVEMYEDEDRSEKGWSLTVYRMQQYASFSDEESDKIIEYLASGEMHKEYFAPPEPEETPEPVKGLRLRYRPTSATLLTPGITRADTGRPLGAAQPNVMVRGWNPGFRALMFAKVMAYIAVISLIMLIVTGFRRKALGKRFRSAHRVLTIILGISVFLHAYIDIQEYGAPPFLWVWFGICAFITIIASHLTGYLRLSIVPKYKVIHYSLGILALAFALLHWFWAWL